MISTLFLLSHSFKQTDVFGQVFESVSLVSSKIHNYSVASARQSVVISVGMELVETLIYGDLHLKC